MSDDSDRQLAYHRRQLHQCSLAIGQPHRTEHELQWWRSNHDYHQAMIEAYEQNAPPEEIEALRKSFGTRRS